MRKLKYICHRSIALGQTPSFSVIASIATLVFRGHYLGQD